MTEAIGRPGRISRGLQLVMIGVGIVSAAGLVLDIAPYFAGSRPFVDWLAWIPMIGLPIAFLAFAGLLVLAVRRRKTL